MHVTASHEWALGVLITLTHRDILESGCVVEAGSMLGYFVALRMGPEKPVGWRDVIDQELSFVLNSFLDSGTYVIFFLSPATCVWIYIINYSNPVFGLCCRR